MRLLCLKSIGVKFKVLVTDKDLRVDDDVDQFAHLLQLTPEVNVDEANWTSVTVHGFRSRHTTR